MAESLEEMFVATKYKRRMDVPEGALFTTNGEEIFRLVSQNGTGREITASPISLKNGELAEGDAISLYKYGEMVYLVEEGSDDED